MSLVVNKNLNDFKYRKNKNIIWKCDVKKFFKICPNKPLFDLVITSPPYNIGKEYEKRIDFENYLSQQRQIIQEIVLRLANKGSICWVVGNYTKNGTIEPIDIYTHPIFTEFGMYLRNRIVW